MDRETIKETLRGAKPYVIRTSDGEAYPAIHPEFVFYGQYNIYVEGPKGGVSIIDPHHVVAILPGRKRGHSKAA